MSKRRNQWHPGYCSAMELGFRKDKDNLEFTRELLLNKKPLQVDLLIIKKKRHIITNNSIGKIFRKYNIVEFKSPRASLNYDTYIKTMGYACLYKAGESHSDQIDMNEITLTFVRSTYPKKLMCKLANEGYEITNPYQGIYYVLRDGFIPAQIVLSKDVCDEDNIWLRSLTDRLDVGTVRDILKAAQELNYKEDKDNAASVLQVSVTSNEDVYGEILKEESEMSSEVLRMWVKDELMKAEQRGLEQGLEQGNRMIYSMVQSKMIKPEDGANQLGITLDQLKANMTNTGYVYPSEL